MSAQKTELFALFDQLNLKTTTADHAPVFTVEEAKKVHDNIPGEDARIDLKAAKDRIGSKRLTFGKPELLMEVLGVEPGSVTPFGLINDKQARTHVILDEAMMRHELLNFHPLKNDATTTISSADLITFIKATGHNPRVVAVSDPA
jgi:Ala-tRNA(Pro) deacylase